MTNEAGETPYIHAAREGHLEFLHECHKHLGQKAKRTLNDNSLNIEAKSKDEWTAFFYAAFNGYV